MDLDRVRGDGCAPATPALPPPGAEASHVDVFSLDNRDLDGRDDWEKGVVVEFKLAAVLALAFVVAAKPRSDEAWLVVLAGVGGLCMAERAMYVSMHFAGGGVMRVSLRA